MRNAKFGTIVIKVSILCLLSLGGVWRALANETWVGGAAGNPTDWNTAANWNPAGVPGVGQNVTVPGGLGFYPVLNAPATSINSMTIGKGASVTINAGGSLLMTGSPTVSGTLTISGGSLSAVGSLNLGGALNVSAGSLSVHNLALSGAATITGGTVHVGQDIGGSGTLSMGGGLLQVGRDFNPLPANFSATGGTVEWTGVADASAFAAGIYNFYNVQIDAGANPGFDNQANTINVAGNWTDNGSATLTQKATTVSFDGSAAQTIGGSSPTTFNNLKIANSAGVTLATSVTVDSALNLSSGLLVTGTNQVIVPIGGSVTGASSGSYVDGNLQKVFPVGNNQTFTFAVGDASTYLPLTMSSVNVTTAGSLTVKSTPGEHPMISTSGINPAKDVNRYWTITNVPSGIVVSSYNATFNFVASDVDSGANPANFVVGLYNGGWSLPTTGTRTATSTTATGLIVFGDFAIGETGSSPAVGQAGQPCMVACCLQADRTAMLTLTGTSGMPYSIMASTDLRNWTKIGSATAGTNGAFHFVDPNAANFSQRFYRAVYP
jgi:hypothetical protein